MVILHVITCASLLFQVFYFILDITFLEFTNVTIFCWILKDVVLCLSFFNITWILLQNYARILNLSCWGRILSSLESLGEVLMVCITYECICCFYSSFLISFRLDSNAMFVCIIYTLHASHTLYLLYNYLCYLLLTPLKNHVWVL